jgi:hypothetical protein
VVVAGIRRCEDVFNYPIRAIGSPNETATWTNRKIGLLDEPDKSTPILYQPQSSRTPDYEHPPLALGAVQFFFSPILSSLDDDDTISLSLYINKSSQPIGIA